MVNGLKHSLFKSFRHLKMYLHTQVSPYVSKVFLSCVKPTTVFLKLSESGLIIVCFGCNEILLFTDWL